MFHLYAEKNKLTLNQQEPVTSGSVNVYPIRFEFSADWDGMTRTAVFRAGLESRAVLLDGSGEAVIPWEVLQKPGVRLFCGVCGVQDGHRVLPTVWADLGTILTGAARKTEVGSLAPVPELWEQELARKGDRLDHTESGALGLWSGDKLLSEVPIESGGDDGVTMEQVAAAVDRAKEDIRLAADQLAAKIYDDIDTAIQTAISGTIEEAY